MLFFLFCFSVIITELFHSSLCKRHRKSLLMSIICNLSLEFINTTTF